ncbi:hypothetical protein B484DRAFT_412213 [Ochromonadaceae sp. CCMP2298]|nr:hypothetical protein B484DRAFT_412213 [Ochromonadaceae sp. CCMP2298]
MSADDELDLGLNLLMGDEAQDSTMEAIGHILGDPSRRYLMFQARVVPPLAPYPLFSALNQHTFECITYLLSDDERLILYDLEGLRRAESSNSDSSDLFPEAAEEAENMETEEAEEMEAMQTSEDSIVESFDYSAQAPAQPRRHRVRRATSKKSGRPLIWHIWEENRNIWEDWDDWDEEEE